MDNVVVKFTAESDMSAAAQDFDSLKAKEAQIIAGMDALKKKQAEFIGAPKVISLLDAEYKKLEGDLKNTRTSMESFAKSTKNVNDTVISGATAQTSLRTQIAAMREELSRMEMAGQDSSRAYIDLSVRTGQLQDQMGDTRQTIQHLSSDTRLLDTAMGAGQGLAAGFNVATSAAALLGGESEELTRAFMKAQAAMNILNGVQEIANVLNKNSALMVNVRTAAEQSSTLAKIKNFGATMLQNATTAVQTGLESKSVIVKALSTAAQWALNTAVLAFPAVAIIAAIAAIVAGFAAFSSGTAEAERAQARLNAENDNFSADMEQRNKLTQQNVEVMKAQGKGIEEIYKYELQRAEQDKKYYSQQYNFLVASKKATKEQLEEAKKNVEDIGTKIFELKSQHIVDEVKAQTDANKKKEEDQKTANEKAIETAKEHAKYLNDIDKLTGETTIAIMEDGTDKKLAELDREHKLKMDSIKGNSKKENDLRLLYDELYIKKRKEILEVKAIEQEKLTGDGVTKIFKETYNKKSDIQTKAEDKLQKSVQNSIKQNADEVQQKTDAEVQTIKDKEELKQAIISESTALIGEIGNALFQGKQDQLSQELSDLDYYYTTDAEAAKENANLKLISEEELAKKKLEIKIKQAKYDKAQAMFNIGLATAQAIISALAMVPPNVPLSIFAGATGLVQLAAVASKPLPAYAKGKKSGGAGHFATVGELGAETMWVPDNAAIIPHNRSFDFDTFKDFNIPIENDSKYIRESIDYDRLGESVGKHVKIPQPKPVTVHVNQSGVNVNYGQGNTTYLNKKYTGSWN